MDSGNRELEKPGAEPAVDARIERERRYYDRGDFTRGTAIAVRRLIMRSIGEFNGFPDRFFEQFDARGRDALDYGCGRGYIAIRLAQEGAASVTGIDLSSTELEYARQRANDAGVGERISFVVGDAHHTPFADASFDLIVGAAILHHVDLELSLQEVKRLLRPGGEAFFIEPLWHNPLLRLGRALSPGTRTADEHPLTDAEWELCSGKFEHFQHTERELVAIPLMPFNLILPHRAQSWLARIVTRADQQLFERFPGSRKYARVTFLQFRR